MAEHAVEEAAARATLEYSRAARRNRWKPQVFAMRRHSAGSIRVALDIMCMYTYWRGGRACRAQL